MKILITICARGGSKGIPGKNIKSLGNKPLIYYSLKTAELFAQKFNADIFLSTDSDEIKNVVKKLNFEDVNLSYNRPDILATDQAGKIDAIIDIKKYAQKSLATEYDFVIDLDVTSPLRTVGDLEKALDILKKSSANNIFSVNSAERNPYFNMVEKNDEGYYELCKKASHFSRQAAPKVYDMNASFYIYSSVFFQNGYKSAITDKSLIFEMNHLCFDLDNPIDFDFMEFLWNTENLGFKLY
ncbi:acylneuraminate cytidylyltransferase family protein [uncultured Nonlabens sp.]|uniref:acylneuraminate cytidylyltransferase family protein n=1 Tax=uncultured Nonlabens sp. TaxID=859306 RepID=UPI0026127BBC|nr:acylneuraminate cytidylyltransferase family protein [uncultured Nonlabens sp.]